MFQVFLMFLLNLRVRPSGLRMAVVGRLDLARTWTNVLNTPSSLPEARGAGFDRFTHSAGPGCRMQEKLGFKD
jgi:hypothetical protein